jgi:hypothetical protein
MKPEQLHSLKTFGLCALAGKTYRLVYRDDLVLGTWSPLVDGIFSMTRATLQIADPSATGLTKRFYRLTLESQSPTTGGTGSAQAPRWPKE